MSGKLRTMAFVKTMRRKAGIVTYGLQYVLWFSNQYMVLFPPWPEDMGLESKGGKEVALPIHTE